MADSIRVTYDLTKLHCVEEGDGSGNAEPFMWTVYFKVDGDTVKVNDQLMLEGTATVVTTPGNHGDLPGDVDAGDDVSIPPSLGHFATTLRPIKTPIAGITVGGMVGCIAVVMEEDSTPDAAIANGHKALNDALKTELNQLIPTLGIQKQAPTEADIDAVEKALKKAVADAVADGVDFWDVLGGLFGNLQDDMIGTARFIFSHDELEGQAGTSFGIVQPWSEDDEDDSEDGTWTLHGKVTVNKQLVAGIARGGDWGNQFLFGRTTAQFVAESQKLFDEKGLRLVHLETWTDFDGVQRWASIHRTGNWGSRLKVGLSTAQLVAQHAAYEGQGFGLQRVAWWNENGQARWAGSWRTGLSDTTFEHGYDTQAFVDRVQYLFDHLNMRLMQAIRYTDGGSQKWAGVFQVGNQAHRFYIRNDIGSLDDTAQELFDDHGLRAIDFETWVEGGKRRFAGISISGNWASRLWTHTGVETFLSEAQQAFDGKGLRLTNVDVYTI